MPHTPHKQQQPFNIQSAAPPASIDTIRYLLHWGGRGASTAQVSTSVDTSTSGPLLLIYLTDWLVFNLQVTREQQ